MSSPPAKSAKARLLAELAVAAGHVQETQTALQDAVAARDARALRAQAAGASYQELGEATSLSKVGVYKMLAKANGGKLSA
jgi:hypothetical protein